VVKKKNARGSFSGGKRSFSLATNRQTMAVPSRNCDSAIDIRIDAADAKAR
jgi:hypothetical protein